MSTYRSKAYRAQQQTASDIWEALGVYYGDPVDGYTPDIAARVAEIHARLMNDGTGEYKTYILGGGYMLGLGDSAREAYNAFIEEDFSAADFDAYALSAADYDTCEG